MSKYGLSEALISKGRGCEALLRKDDIYRPLGQRCGFEDHCNEKSHSGVPLRRGVECETQLSRIFLSSLLSGRE